MKTQSIIPLAEERAFTIDELFFSCTDKRGVITSCNEVFCRISGYQVDELLGKPHNIIRHPDMPRAVFKLLWQFLEGGKPIVAYVKNMARDGRYYWVLALAIPIDDGYLSIRLKPTTATFEAIKDVYNELLKIETSYSSRGEEAKIGMQASYDRLIEIINSLGFNSYEEFMRKALLDELQSRENLRSQAENFDQNSVEVDPKNSDIISQYKHAVEIKTHLKGLFAQVNSFLNLKSLLQTNSNFIGTIAFDLRRMALNASVSASHYGQAGASLGVIAERMGSNAVTLTDSVKQLSNVVEQVDEAIIIQSFGLATATLFVDVSAFFLKEILTAKDSLRNISNSSNLKLLTTLLRTNIISGLEKTDFLLKNLSNLEFEIDQLMKIFRTLSFVRVVGKVEAARVENSGTFTHLVSEVIKQVDEAQGELTHLNSTLVQILDNKVDVGPIKDLLNLRAY